jgi:superfamily II RNA helicase
VLYVPVKDFDESNGDEVISLLSRYQYTDWTALRLEAPSSPEYRKELHKLAQKLADVAESVAKKQLEREIEVIERAENQDATASLGLIDLMEKIAELLPSWLEAMESDVINDAQFNATWEVLGERLSRLRRRPGSDGAELP